MVKTLLLTAAVVAVLLIVLGVSALSQGKTAAGAIPIVMGVAIAACSVWVLRFQRKKGHSS
ncbi:hypothetical protein [Streptomyces sp. Act143]|uniref:hypothetical protein n=1 Tax=Streptomyces sp. Act143 TaxID=2200760 RepID=UPI0011B451B5|nr:hypothetical protein [Streptomyces sp. Act143]